ncbi:hypothetical protein [Yoonia litorea]|uniref:TVP38/TMEM64 family membrane protein n=1 Tax=Yoonia litorea TaxID=1123755 RepID=A0A1I6MDM5_9RHOB|nr:hypothetical protein [Yoonia litorea]SFS13819.1 hypothetical protein SAMN05444714_1609 [Yoonia litorea]
MTRLLPPMRSDLTGTPGLVLSGTRLIGLALIVGVAGWLAVRMSAFPATLLAELQIGMPSFSLAWIILLLYVVLLAIPFVPSAEIGLAVMLALGSSMAVPVYAATVLGLTIAFIAGRHAHLYRRGNGAGDDLWTSDGIALLQDRLCHRPALRRLLRFRGLAFIAMINMPANTVVGGGGGIAMAMGYSRLLTFRQFLFCAAVAVAPVPTLFLAADFIGFETSVRSWLDHVFDTQT